jgi:hypothetical protein
VKKKRKAIETLETEGTENNYLEVKTLLNLVENQQKEIDEKSTIIMVGAKKVKQLEKEIEEIKNKYKDLFFQNFDLWEKNIFPLKTIREDYISKDKIKELKEKVEKEMISNPYDFSYMINELLEEN